MPERDAEPSVFAAEVLTFDGRTYRDGTDPVAFVVEKGPTARRLIYRFFAANSSMNNVQRTIWLRDRWYEPLIVINRPRTFFNDRIGVVLPDGTPIGLIRERGFPGPGMTAKRYELRDPEGRRVATVRKSRDGSRPARFEVVAADGSELAVLTAPGAKADMSRLRLTAGDPDLSGCSRCRCPR